MGYIVRPIRRDEWALLEDFLYEAIFVPDGFEGELPRSVIHDDPKCRAAFEGFGTLPDDRALVAEVDGEVVGACWVRTTDEYGHIDSATPSFSISIYKPYRGRGIGTAMMSRMLDELLEAGYTRASLSVQKENPALRLYERMGFRIVGDGADETEWLMVRDLCGHEISSATLESADAIYRLVQTTIHAVYPDCYDPAVVAAFSCLHSPDVIRADIAAGKIFILKVGDRIVGTGTVKENHIMRVFVLPEEQSKGYGTRIMDELEAIAARSHSAAVLEASVPARAFYLNRGYRVAGTQTWEIEPCDDLPATTLVYEVMEKEL